MIESRVFKADSLRNLTETGSQKLKIDMNGILKIGQIVVLFDLYLISIVCYYFISFFKNFFKDFIN